MAAGSWLVARWRRHERMLRFLIVGSLNTLLGILLYPLMLYGSGWLRQHYLIALAVSQALSLCFAFLMYKIAVFRTRANVAREAGTFASFYVVLYTANWIALPALVEWAQISPSVAQIAFSIFGVAASYLWHNNVTFSSSRGR